MKNNPTGKAKANVLTFDSDWCPSMVLELVLDMLDAAGGYKGVFFLTNRLEESLMARLRDNKNIQIGIHPNLRFYDPGFSIDTVIDNLINEIPEATACRIHRLIWWPAIAKKLKVNGILYDSSVIMPYNPSIIPYRVHGIFQFPIYFGDSYFMIRETPFSGFSSVFKRDAMLRVFNFHPIHIYANTTCDNDWQTIKKVLHNKDKLREAVEKIAVKNKKGIRDLFEQLIGILKPGETYTLEEVSGLSEGEE